MQTQRNALVVIKETKRPIHRETRLPSYSDSNSRGRVKALIHGKWTLVSVDTVHIEPSIIYWLPEKF